MSTTTDSCLRDVLLDLLTPWNFIRVSLGELPPTIFNLLRQRDLATLLSPSRLQDAWFGRFWGKISPAVRLNAERNVVPLLRGRVAGGAVLADGDEGGSEPVSGTVIEIGPGSGMWVSLFSDKYLRPSPPSSSGAAVAADSGGDGDDANSSGLRRRGAAAEAEGQVTRVFGVEPNADLHGALSAKVHEAGLDGTYQIVPVGIEDLASSGRVQKESVDCVVSVLCLCGIPEPEKNIRELYSYLKPGGRWYVYEHVKCVKSQGWFMGAYQGT